MKGPRMPVAALPGRGLAALALVGLVATADLQAQEVPAPPPQALEVGLYVSPPFVMEENGRYTGMAVEL